MDEGVAVYLSTKLLFEDSRCWALLESFHPEHDEIPSVRLLGLLLDRVMLSSRRALPIYAELFGNMYVNKGANTI